MRSLDLKKSPVNFHEDGHTYDLNGKTLSGVTPIIHWLFPETYRGIPQSVLDQAADYGSMIHKKIELADTMGIVDDEAVQAYVDLKEMKGVKTIANEYTVSDERRIASQIDAVMDNLDLWDFKTTSKVHIPNVTVQLSIYAWLFEMQTGLEAGDLYCCWLPKPQYGSPDLIKLKRVSVDVCKYIVEVWEHEGDVMSARSVLAQTGFEFEKQRTSGDIPDAFMDLAEELITIKQTMEQLTEREKVIKEIFLNQMKQEGTDKWQSDIIQFSRKEAYERTSLDSTALKKKMPEVYEQFKKVTKYAESITYKVL